MTLIAGCKHILNFMYEIINILRVLSPDICYIILKDAILLMYCFMYTPVAKCFLVCISYVLEATHIFRALGLLSAIPNIV